MAEKIVKLDVYGGLLGVGKTTLIRQMLKTAYKGYKVAIIENEIGKVNLDEEVLKDPAIEVKPLTSGCICCTVKGVFTEAVSMLVKQENPDYIIIEPTGAADFAVVAGACTEVECVELNRTIMVVNGKKFLKLLNVAGEFLYDQIRASDIIFFNFCEVMSDELITQTKLKIWEINPDAHVICVPLTEVDSTVFPDGLVSYHEKEPEKKPGIRIDAAQAGLLKKTNAADNAARMRAPGNRGSETDSWIYHFTKPFTGAMKQKLDKLFCDEENHDLFRGKGYLTMADGSICKVDYSYGDAFEETVSSFNQEKINILVMIGKGRMKRKALKICKEIDEEG